MNSSEDNNEQQIDIVENSIDPCVNPDELQISMKIIEEEEITIEVVESDSPTEDEEMTDITYSQESSTEEHEQFITNVFN